MLVQRETQKKLDSHSIEATLLGYCEQSKAYKLLNNDNKNIIISRDVIFNENFHKHQNIVDNEEEEELIDSTFLLVPPTITLNQQPNINTNSFLPTQSLYEQQQMYIKLTIVHCIGSKRRLKQSVKAMDDFNRKKAFVPHTHTRTST